MTNRAYQLNNVKETVNWLLWTNLVKILLKPYLKSSRIFELEVRYFANLFVAPGWDMDHRKFKENLEIQKMWKQTHCRWNLTNMNKRFDWLPTRPVGGILLYSVQWNGRFLCVHVVKLKFYFWPSLKIGPNSNERRTESRNHSRRLW